VKTMNLDDSIFSCRYHLRRCWKAV